MAIPVGSWPARAARKLRLPAVKRRKPVAELLPRERMTEKARAATSAYVRHRIERVPHVEFAITETLRAERMRRKDLYAWLVTHGYRWQQRTWVRREAPPGRRVVAE